MNKLCIIQPFLPDYRREVFFGMAQHCPVDLVISPIPSSEGFGSEILPNNSRIRFVTVPTLKPLGEKVGIIQWGVGKYVRRERPDAIFTFANPRYFSFWTTLIWGKLLGIPTYVHGHGLFKKHRISFAYRIMMKALLRLVTSYICYAPIVRQSFIDYGFSDRKLTVAHNSVINPYPLIPSEKTGDELGVLFVGRLRQGSELELLIRVLDRIRQSDRIPVTLQVIGNGTEESLLHNLAKTRPWIVQHGQIYDPAQIQQISRNCFVGCYPGNAGLSVIHMMSLSLPVVTHDDLSSHQGPEPSFIRNGVSGILYDHKNREESLYQAIKSLALDPGKRARMQRASFEEYQSLVNPPLWERFWSILGDGGERAQIPPSPAACLDGD